MSRRIYVAHMALDSHAHSDKGGDMTVLDVRYVSTVSETGPDTVCIHCIWNLMPQKQPVLYLLYLEQSWIQSRYSVSVDPWDQLTLLYRYTHFVIQNISWYVYPLYPKAYPLYPCISTISWPYPDHILTISWPYPVYSNISDAYPDHILSIFCAYSVQHILAISAIFAPYLCPYSEHVGDVGDVGHVLQIMVDRAVDANRTLFTERFRLQAVSCVQAVWWGVQEMWYRLEELTDVIRTFNILAEVSPKVWMPVTCIGLFCGFAFASHPPRHMDDSSPTKCSKLPICTHITHITHMWTVHTQRGNDDDTVSTARNRLWL